MKISALNAIGSLALAASAHAQDFSNWIRQIQVNSGAEWDVTDIAKTGERQSPLAINPGGARFELWTLNTQSLQDYLLDERYVGSYVPQATMRIISEDPYVTRVRTRADRPFTVELSLAGMSEDPTDRDATRMANIKHCIQSYGPGGTGEGLDPSAATIVTDGIISENGNYTFSFTGHNLSGSNPAKVRGEERFLMMSLEDDVVAENYYVPPHQLAAASIQIWPVADGSIAGIEEGEQLRFAAPDLTITLNDLYPESATYAQVYPGPPALGTVGTVVPGSSIVINSAVPEDKILLLDDWDSVIDESGQYTMELLTETPFGVDRLAYLSFSINRDIEVNGTVTTVE